MNNLEKGEYAILKVCERALEKGIIISKPAFEACRYDLIVDDNGKLQRTQVKWADGSTRSPGSVKVNLDKYKCRSGMISSKPYFSTEVDLLLVYVPKLNRICAFPPHIWEGKTSMYIRVCDSLNGREYACHHADNYLW